MSKLQWESTRYKILAVQPPANTSSYTAVPHRVFLEELQQQLNDNGYIIDNERYLGNKGYNVLTGTLTLRKSIELEKAPEIRPAIFFGNSYDKSKVAKISVGAQVLVCRNGMIGMATSSNYVRKHTGTALDDVRGQMSVVIETIDAEFARLQQNKEEMKTIILSKDQRAQLAGDMIINENMLTMEQISILKREITNSKDFRDDSLWSFYNNCTEAFKHTHPMLFEKQHLKLHAYITDSFALTGARGLYKTVFKKEASIQLELFQN